MSALELWSVIMPSCSGWYSWEVFGGSSECQVKVKASVAFDIGLANSSLFSLKAFSFWPDYSIRGGYEGLEGKKGKVIFNLRFRHAGLPSVSPPWHECSLSLIINAHMASCLYSPLAGMEPPGSPVTCSLVPATPSCMHPHEPVFLCFKPVSLW